MKKLHQIITLVAASTVVQIAACGNLELVFPKDADACECGPDGGEPEVFIASCDGDGGLTADVAWPHQGKSVDSLNLVHVLMMDTKTRGIGGFPDGDVPTEARVWVPHDFSIEMDATVRVHCFEGQTIKMILPP